jgi:Tetratricopeptide repeat
VPARIAAAALAACLLAGCAANPFDLLPPGAHAAPVELARTPFFPQEDYQCGPAALATVLTGTGVRVAPDELVPLVYVPGRRGSFQAEIVAAARSHDRLPYVIAPRFSALLAEVESGRPVLVLQNLGVALIPAWHYAVVVGFSPDEGEVILRSGTDRRRITPAGVFARTWERSGNWGMVALRPGELPGDADRDRYLDAAAAAEAAGRFDLAAPAYASAAAKWPASAIAWLGLGNAAYHRGEFVEAERDYRRALELEPGNAAARNNLATAVLEQGRCVEAARLMDAGSLAPAADTALAAALTATRADIAACASKARQ